MIALIGLFFYWKISKNNASKERVLFVLNTSLVILFMLQYESISYVIFSYILLLLLNSTIFFLGKFIRKKPKTSFIIVSLLVLITIMFLFKLLNPFYSDDFFLANIAVPLGISYYLFKQMHYIIDCSRGHFTESTLLTFTNYTLFFPIFIAGPIERFQHFNEQSNAINFDPEKFKLGIERIIIGLGQKLILSDLILHSFIPDNTFYLDYSLIDLAWPQLLFACFIKFFTLYFDFAGYTSIAIGISLLFGYKVMENFNFPILRPTLAEFWRNWHISLSSWARDYVYFPILMTYRLPSIALLATMLTIGLWHSIEPGWVLWGFHHGLGLIILSKYQKWAIKFKRFTQIRESKLWFVLSTLFVWWYVSLAYALTYEAESISTSLSLYLKVISFGIL